MLKNLEDLLKRISKLKILVIGDLMLDHYIFGDTHRISPEAPVPVIDIEHKKETLGGASNVALNLRSIGVDVEILGTFGEDGNGNCLGNLLSTHSIKYHPCCQQKHVRTILKTRIIVRNQQLCRLDVEDSPEKYNLEKNIDLESLSAQISHYNAIIFSDYAKGVITQSIVNSITEIAQRHGVIVAVDPKPKNGIEFQGVDILKPNQSEAFEMLGMKNIHENFDAVKICREIFAQSHPKNLIITLGKNGMIVAQNGEILEQIPSNTHEIFDVTGAGDTSIAFLTAAFAAGENIIDAAKFANLAAGIVVGKLGTATVTTEEILNQNRLA